MFSNIKILSIIFCTILFISSCKKEKNDDIINKATIKTITYYVEGTNFSLNYIDSNSIFHTNEVYKNSFRYQFKKGSGAGIGITINKVSPSDTIHLWNVLIDNKLYANAFSEGGVYFFVPYN